MSQDLLAAFGQDPKPKKHSAAPTKHAQPFFLFDSLDPSINQGGRAPHVSLGAIPSSNLQNPKGLSPLDPIDDANAIQGFEDEWGDFEGSTEVKPAPSTAARTSAKAPAPIPVATQFSRWLDEEDDGFKDYAKTERAPKTKKWDFTKPELRSARPSQSRDPNVLFDAEHDEPIAEDEDDFGDFEGADAAPTKPLEEPIVVKPASGLDDLLGLDDSTGLSQPPTSFRTDSKAMSLQTSSLLDLGDLTLGDESTTAGRTEEKKPPIHSFGTLGPSSIPQSPSKVTVASMHKEIESLDRKRSEQPAKAKQQNVLRKAPSPNPVATEDDEQWDDFDVWEQNGPAQASPMPALTPTQEVQSPIRNIPPALTSPDLDSNITSPPTNIPPPALVLSLFSPLFASAESSFFKPLRQETTDVQQAIYAETAAVTYLKGMLALATVCGRVIAGRKHRWKRDTILAQSMRIGAAGGISGLKLTSIDKAEVAKEDREAADALKAWQAQAGKLKSAIADVKRVQGVDVGKIPELKESLPIKVAKEIEGGLKGHRACALCGLKREERVLRVDFKVEDSFGEWWVDNVSMHRACRNFWEQHRDTLKSR